MPENQSQPNEPDSGANSNGGPAAAPQPDLKSQEARPSDAEIAHAPEEGGAVRDSRMTPEARDSQADENRGSLGGRPGKDLAGEAQTGERLGDRGGRLGA